MEHCKNIHFASSVEVENCMGDIFLLKTWINICIPLFCVDLNPCHSLTVSFAKIR